MAVHTFGIGVGAVVGIGGEQTVVRALGGRIGSRLVVVVQEVVRAALSGIGTFAAVVVDDVVESLYSKQQFLNQPLLVSI